MENSLETAVIKLLSSLSIINSWLKNQIFHSNSLKCKLIMFMLKNYVPPFIYLNNAKFDYVTKLKSQGLILDGLHLNWLHHINHLRDVCS